MPDLLLHLDSYPDPATKPAIDGAVILAAALGGKLTALAYQVVVPLESNRLADWVVDLSALVRAAEAKSAEACKAAIGRFTEQAKAAGTFGAALTLRADLFDVADDVARRARTRDLTIVPLTGAANGHREVAQSVIFGSGRPVLVFTPGRRPPPRAFDTIAIAWDGEARAARSVADALPLLKRAKQVRVFTIVGEKPSATGGLAADLVRHLQTHGVAAAVDEVAARGRRIGAALDAYIRARRPDLLVMGAFGHSRLREFILGGATEHMLAKPLAPVFLAH
jgi:nucleotide-binding universal stress UspA family protein